MITLYDVSAPVFLHNLGQLALLLDKGQEHARSSGIDPSVLVQARLAPDMFPLSGQVQSACDAAKLAVGRLTGVAPPRYEDTETTFAELQQRISDTRAFIASTPADAFAGSEERVVTVKHSKGERVFTGKAYLLHFALPNFFFHVTTAYAVLRNQGVAVGKMDYLGQV